LQWVDELQRHITPGTLSLKVYVGQHQPSSAPTTSSNKRARRTSSANARDTAAAAAAAGAAAAAAAAGQVVTAAELAAADIVLTTYDVLKREVALQPDADGASEYSFRRRKRCAWSSAGSVMRLYATAGDVLHAFEAAFVAVLETEVPYNSNVMKCACVSHLFQASVSVNNAKLAPASRIIKQKLSSNLACHAVLQVRRGAHPPEPTALLQAGDGRGAAGAGQHGKGGGDGAQDSGATQMGRHRCACWLLVN
jgi:hypothetical protein